MDHFVKSHHKFYNETDHIDHYFRVLDATVDDPPTNDSLKTNAGNPRVKSYIESHTRDKDIAGKLVYNTKWINKEQAIYHWRYNRSKGRDGYK